LPADWKRPDPPPGAVWTAPPDQAREQDAIEFSWVGETARHVGAVVHRWLQRIAEDELRGWNGGRVESMRDGFRRELAARGVQEAELSAAAERVAIALARSLEDPQGRWLLGPQRESRNEYRLTALLDGERRTLVIDRTFLAPDGKRWIADYKTSSHEGTDLEGFLDRERERYQAQLQRYARALAAGEEAMLGLYFPLPAGWRQWPAVKSRA
jgi:ATP-dependent exoDNAse (exonuclease V) beta subunit